mgnify:FL=1
MSRDIDSEPAFAWWVSHTLKKWTRIINKSLPVGSTHIPYHIIFDVKYDLTRKARLVAGGHRHKDVSAHLSYLSVASRESVRIGFLLAALNGLEIMSCDIGNAYLNASNREKGSCYFG